jgi:hypothetical protein
VTLLRIGEKMAANHIRQALAETMGPGTKAGELAVKVVQGANEFKRRFLEAQAQIQAEDSE